MHGQHNIKISREYNIIFNVLRKPNLKFQFISLPSFIRFKQLVEDFRGQLCLIL